MNSTSRRVTNIGLALLGVLVLLVAFASVSSAAMSPVVGFGIVIAYLVAVFFLYRRADLGALAESLQRRQATLTAATRMSGAARRAAARAKAHPDSGYGSELTVLDVGMLINERRGDGGWDRRIAQESAALDDEFLQPYVKLFAPAGSAERHVTLTFEFYDRSGRLQFSHNMTDYLRTGENLILCERQLALRSAQQPMRAGTWDLRVKVDGVLVALHNFNMASTGGAMRPATRLSAVRDDHEEAPSVSLEELLREQARRHSE
ncbi:MAG: hypothetical protein CUN49_01460 [Candidatus Thermofonsia Clade 1 bacterium]|jgi:hypothetical protein|uniref:Uncharacterized protein n=1 Tax=Candidatus Thermofonsia Clade 1 bacterium TaxID=2364210 RepID=A0A2M8PI40_9CHLR|nr:MAG: hypothetical protein CUN49_01460 [Candidatus Thermofonsia Clade 1 bacterium]